MSKPRLIVVGPLPPPPGGVETVTKAVLESNAFREFEIHHLDISKDRPKETAGRLDLGNLRWAMIHFIRMLRSMRSLRPNVVYMPLVGSWTGFSRDSVLAWIGKWYGAKVLGHVHGAWFYRVLALRGILGWMARKCLSRFDALLVLGTWWKDLVGNYGYPGQVFVVPPTLDRRLFEAGHSHTRAYDSEEPVGLFVGSVGKRKGVFELLEALHRLKLAGTRARVVIVGGQEEEGEWRDLMRRRAELGLDNIAEFVGPLHGQSLYEQFQRADYFILPSHAEGLPVVLLEAGSFGLPVIVTPVGAVRDLVKDNENGLLVSPGDVGALAAAIGRLRSSPQDRARFGTKLRRSVGAYHPDAVCTRIAETIQAVLNAGDGAKADEQDRASG
jgi:glycosyltransferase involved in cell wall biosynthesis